MTQEKVEVTEEVCGLIVIEPRPLASEHFGDRKWRSESTQ